MSTERKLTPMPAQSWVFDADMAHVVDGDTVDALIDSGFHGTRKERLRLLRVNAPERKGATLEAGNAARDYVSKWLAQGALPALGVPASEADYPFTIQTYRTDVFGRYLALIWRKSDGRCLNDDLVASGHAVPFMDDTVRVGRRTVYCWREKQVA